MPFLDIRPLHQGIVKGHVGQQPEQLDGGEDHREQAAELGIDLPKGDLLDHELVFVNYRLMARRMKMAYAGDADDSAFGLWRKGLAILANGNYGGQARMANRLWLTALLLSPSRIARTLVELLFNRGGRKFGKFGGIRRRPALAE